MVFSFATGRKIGLHFGTFNNLKLIQMKKLLASAALVTGIFLTGCGDGTNNDTASDTATTTMSADTLNSGGSLINATDTSRLRTDTIRAGSDTTRTGKDTMGRGRDTSRRN